MTEQAKGETNEAESGANPLSAVYTGEVVNLIGKDVRVRPWGVEALMTEVPAIFGRLLAKVAPLFELVKGNELKAEDILSFLMQNTARELVEFVAWSVGMSEGDVRTLSAGDYLKLARAVVRQNKDFFDQLGGMYEDMGRPIASGLAGIGSRSSSPSGEPGSPSGS